MKKWSDEVVVHLRKKKEQRIIVLREELKHLDVTLKVLKLRKHYQSKEKDVLYRRVKQHHK